MKLLIIFNCSFLQGSHKGLSLLDKVYNFLNLEEKDYFGLRYLDLSDQTVSGLFC